MKKFILPIGMLLACMVSLQAQQLHKSFSSIKKIRINTASGNCVLIKGSGSEVVVDLNHTYGDVYKPEVIQEGDRLQIREAFTSNSSRGDAKWSITLPDGVDLKFSSGSGSFEASNLSLDLEVKSGSGEIQLYKVTGDVRGTSGSGNVDLEDFNGELKATSGSGDVIVKNVKGEIEVSSGSGNIKIKDSKASFSANSGSGTVEGRGVVLDGASKFNSGSGDAEIVLASSPKFDISVNSGSGNALLDFNGNAIEGVVVMKANKRNGEINAPFPFDKTEEVENGDQVTVVKTTAKGKATTKISIGTGSGEAALKN